MHIVKGFGVINKAEIDVFPELSCFFHDTEDVGNMISGSSAFSKISVRFQGKPFNTTVIQVYAQSSNAEEAEIEWFYEDLQDLLELTPKKDVLFIVGTGIQK